MLWCRSLNPIIMQGPVYRRRLCSRAQVDGGANAKKKKKVVVVGSGWAGLGAAHHLCNQGFDVTVLDDGPGPDDVGIQVIDFDNTDAAWRKYDSVTARELFKQFGCSENLYRNILKPLLQVGLFAPPEQCSAAATLALFYYLILSHQKDFDMVWCRGTVREMIFNPWTDSLKERGCRFLKDKPVTDFILSDDDSGDVTQVICGRDKYEADAVILATRISTLQETIRKSAALCKREEFLRVLNLRSVDVISVKLELDSKVAIPHSSNACSVFEDSYGWTFFDLNSIYDAYNEEEQTMIRADFYNASELMGTTDELIVEKAISYVSKCIKDFKKTIVMEADVQRFPQSLPHFFPGSYKHMMRGSTSVRNMFVAGEWVINRHGSCLQEKAYVTGLEAANGVVDFVEEGSFARIIPIQEEEAHVEALRNLNRTLNQLISQLPLSIY